MAKLRSLKKISYDDFHMLLKEVELSMSFIRCKFLSGRKNPWTYQASIESWNKSDLVMYEMSDNSHRGALHMGGKSPQDVVNNLWQRVNSNKVFISRPYRAPHATVKWSQEKQQFVIEKQSTTVLFN